MTEPVSYRVDEPGAPTEYSEAGSSDGFWEEHSLHQVTSAHDAAEELFSSANDLLALSVERAEEYARRALRSCAEAYWYAERGSHAAGEHAYLHEIGHWTRTVFGCELDFDGSDYSTSCPVLLADKRYGFSVGYVARKWCSICDEDISECGHRRRSLYWVRGGPTSFGPCRVCGGDGCHHEPDRLYKAPVVSVVKEIEMLEEVSLVHVPAQPLARPVKLQIDASELAQALGADFHVGVRVSCDHCLETYHGLPEPLPFSESIASRDRPTASAASEEPGPGGA